MPKPFTHCPPEFQSLSLTESYRHGERFYVTPDGAFPSVTTVTGHAKKQFFAQWRIENPDEATRTQKRGTELHKLIETYLLNEAPETDGIAPNSIKLFEQLQPEINKIDNIHALEAPLWSKTLGLAGRVDCVAEYDGKLSIIDFKGSTKPKQEKYIDNYLAQTCAYALMWQERTGVKIDNYAIMVACEDGTNTVFQGRPISYVRHLKKMIDGYHQSKKHA